ncbi:DDE superfamily endonuclease [Hirsutella rhossiliensis]
MSWYCAPFVSLGGLTGKGVDYVRFAGTSLSRCPRNIRFAGTVSLLAERISFAVETFGLLPTNHFGARKRRSAEQALVLLQEKIYKAWRMGKVLSLVNFDVKGAYNGVFRIGFYNGSQRGFARELVRWVDAFCSERTASITQELPQAGLPQGSPLSPILFLFFNADLVQTKISTSGGSIAFVDDYSAEWEKRSGATFEGDKTTIIHFTRMAERSSSSPFVIKGRTIWPQENAKGLETAMQLKRLRGLSPRVARQLFTAAVAPAMDYASTEGYWLNRAQMVGAQAVTELAEAEASIRPVVNRHTQAAARFWISVRTLRGRILSPGWASECAEDSQHGESAGQRLEVIREYAVAPWEDRIRVLCDLDDDQAAELVAKAQGIVVATSSSERRGVVGMGGCVRDTRVNNEQEALASYSITLGPREDQNPYVAELEAIATALRCMPARLEQRELVFVTSNRSAMQAIGQPRQQSGQYIIKKFTSMSGSSGNGVFRFQRQQRGKRHARAHPGELAISSPLDKNKTTKTGNSCEWEDTRKELTRRYQADIRERSTTHLVGKKRANRDSIVTFMEYRRQKATYVAVVKQSRQWKSVFLPRRKSMSDGDKWKPNLPAYWQTRDAEHLEKWAFKQACQRRNWRLKCTDRSKMWGFWVLQSKVEDLSCNNFQHLTQAIIELQSQDRPKYAETARKYNIDKSTLWRRFKGKTASNHDANSYSRQKLTSAQEEILIGHVNKLTNRGIPPTPQMLKNIAEEIAGTKLGVNWVSRFRKRHHDRLSSLYLRTIDHQRKAADNSGISKLLQFSKTAFIVISRVYCRQYSVKCRKLREKIEKYNISPSNVYNFDEKGFQIGLSRSAKRVVPREALRRGKLVGASQDGNREFITLIAAICADYSYLPPALIYKGESKDFQDTWLEDFDHSSEVAFFASTENGWSCDALGLHWLQRIFDCHTKQKAGRAYRLLILDGHNSHINLKFIDYADRNRILIAVLPSHSTHRLQPLDVDLFSALSTYYAQGSEQLVSIGWGLIRLTKRNFWPLFRDAWNQAFTAKNIEAGWRATGIHPLDPGKVLSKISHSSDVTPPQTASEERAMKTPGSLRAIRRITRRLRKEGLMDSRVTALSRASEKLATQYELVQHENRDLQEALKLAHKGNAERPWAFSIQKKVVASRSFSVQPRWNWRGDADEQRKQAIEDRPLQALREQRSREKTERAAEREAKRAEKREAAAKLKAERSAREAERQAIREVKFEVAATSKPGVRGHKDMVARVCATGIQPRNNSEEERVKIGSEASVARDHRKYGGRFLSLSGLIFALACRSGNFEVRYSRSLVSLGPEQEDGASLETAMNLNTNRRGRSTHLFSNHDAPQPPSMTEGDTDKAKASKAFSYWNRRPLRRGDGPSSTDDEAQTGRDIPAAKTGKPWNSYKEVYKILDFEGDISLAISTKSPRRVVNIRSFPSVDTGQLPLAYYHLKHKNIVSILEIFNDSPNGFYFVSEEMTISLPYPSELQAVALLRQVRHVSEEPLSEEPLTLAWKFLQPSMNTSSATQPSTLSYQNVLLKQNGVVKLGAQCRFVPWTPIISLTPSPSSPEKLEKLNRDILEQLHFGFCKKIRGRDLRISAGLVAGKWQTSTASELRQVRVLTHPVEQNFRLRVAFGSGQAGRALPALSSLKMDLPEIYAACMLLIFALLLVVSNWPAGKRVRRLSATVTNKIAYSVMVKRHRMLGPWLFSSSLLNGTYVAVNVSCVFCKISFEASTKGVQVLSLASPSEAASRAGYLSVVNLMPLYLSLHHSFIADIYKKAHRVSGMKFDINSWVDIKKLLVCTLTPHRMTFESMPLFEYGGVICFINICYSFRILCRNTNLNLPWPRAFLKRLDGSIYMVIRVSQPLKVAAGQYINVWIPSLQFWSSHPYTISRYWWSEKRSNLEMLVEPHRGLSQKLWHSLVADESAYVERRVFFTGPHGARIPHERFNIVVMIAEGFGVLSIRTRQIRVVWMKRASDPSHILNLFNEALDKDLSAKRMKVLVHEDGRRLPENVGRVAILPGAPDFQKILTDPDAFHPKKSYFAASEDHTGSTTLVLVSSGTRVRDKVKEVASASSHRITVREMDFQPLQDITVGSNALAKSSNFRWKKSIFWLEYYSTTLTKKVSRKVILYSVSLLGTWGFPASRLRCSSLLRGAFQPPRSDLLPMGDLVDSTMGPVAYPIGNS